MLKDIGVDRAGGGVQPGIEPFVKAARICSLKSGRGWAAVTALMPARPRPDSHTRQYAYGDPPRRTLEAFFLSGDGKPLRGPR